MLGRGLLGPRRSRRSLTLLRWCVPPGASIASTGLTRLAYAQLLDFVIVNAPGPRPVWAVEGSRSYDIGLVRFL